MPVRQVPVRIMVCVATNSQDLIVTVWVQGMKGQGAIEVSNLIVFVIYSINRINLFFQSIEQPTNQTINQSINQSIK